MATEPSLYWASGIGILRDYHSARGGTVIELDLGVLSPAAVGDELAGNGATALLLLAGYPDPAVPTLPSRATTRSRSLAAMLRSHGPDRARMAESWPRVAGEGTRGQIRFSRLAGISVWQWAWPPIQVADRDPARPDRFRVLATS